MLPANIPPVRYNKSRSQRFAKILNTATISTGISVLAHRVDPTTLNNIIGDFNTALENKAINYETVNNTFSKVQKDNNDKARVQIALSSKSFKKKHVKALIAEVNEIVQETYGHHNVHVPGCVLLLSFPGCTVQEMHCDYDIEKMNAESKRRTPINIFIGLTPQCRLSYLPHEEFRMLEENDHYIPVASTKNYNEGDIMAINGKIVHRGTAYSVFSARIFLPVFHRAYQPCKTLNLVHLISTQPNTYAPRKSVTRAREIWFPTKKQASKKAILVEDSDSSSYSTTSSASESDSEVIITRKSARIAQSKTSRRKASPIRTISSDEEDGEVSIGIRSEPLPKINSKGSKRKDRSEEELSKEDSSSKRSSPEVNFTIPI